LATIGGDVLGRLTALSIQLCVVGTAASEQRGDRERRQALGQTLAVKNASHFLASQPVQRTSESLIREAKKKSLRGDAWHSGKRGEKRKRDVDLS